MSGYLYDEDYDPMDDQESLHGWFHAALAAVLMLVLTKPLWIDPVAQYVTALKRTPTACGNDVCLDFEPDTLKRIREYCSTSDSMSFSIAERNNLGMLYSNCVAFKKLAHK